MRVYARKQACLMQQLQQALDDPDPAPCGRCGFCTGQPVVGNGRPDDADVEAARQWMRGSTNVIEARKMWPSGLADRKGRIDGADQGRAVAYADDPAWPGVVAEVRSGHAGPDSLEGALRVLGQWRREWPARPTMIVALPGPDGGTYARELAEAIGAAGKLPVVDVVAVGRRAGTDRRFVRRPGRPTRQEADRRRRCRRLRDGAARGRNVPVRVDDHGRRGAAARRRRRPGAAARRPPMAVMDVSTLGCVAYQSCAASSRVASGSSAAISSSSSPVLEALVGLRRKVVGEGLDALVDGVTLLAQPTVLAHQAAFAHPLDHCGELRRRKVVDPSELLRGHVLAECEQHVRFETPDPLDHQGCDVPVAAVLAHQGSGMEEAGHDLLGDRERTQRGVHRPALQRCAGRGSEQQVGRAAERWSVDEIAQDPAQRLHATQLASGDRRFGRGGQPHLRDVAGHLTGSEVVEQRVHHLRRNETQRCRPSSEVGVPVVGEPEGEHRLVGFVGRVGDDTDRLDQLEHPAGRRAHRCSSSCNPVVSVQMLMIGSTTVRRTTHRRSSWRRHLARVAPTSGETSVSGATRTVASRCDRSPLNLR